MYKFIEHTNDKAKVGLEYLESLEATHGFHFPAVLKDYYLRFNGSTIKECRFEKCGFEFCVVRLFSLNYGTMPIEKILAYNSQNKAIPASFVPLALDEDEDDYYWDSLTEKVYYLSFGNVEHPIQIADSIETFFEMLSNSCPPSSFQS